MVFDGKMKGFHEIFLLLILLCCITGLESAHTLTLDPIEPHHPGDPVVISGTKPEETSRMGIEVFPIQYWEYACRFGETNHAKHFRFVLQYLSETLNDAPFVKLVRFNPDKTQSYIQYPNCPDHILIHPYVPFGPGNTRWNAELKMSGKKESWNPGSYIVLVWDASGQVLYSETYQPNGWDTSGDYVYPATMRGNIWDLENKQECVNRIFSIQ
ncbi:MAG TPA: hypothetical protein VN429_03570 [Methanospirillum sp.]|uniref:hypothetical protein n=1 Tax=Methanospirillum sp. TaxID=45200 RepID=UPI002D15AE11|nr:hypothetical protein [Methanospirillum sp.]HWQ63470.1 hypothetical protein [Methanospirillum sp.]